MAAGVDQGKRAGRRAAQMAELISLPDGGPVVVGTGLTGLALSRALSAAGVRHVLVGDRPGSRPRLGESLNVEGSLEIARQLPDLSRFFHRKKQMALFFDRHVVAFNSIQLAAGRSFNSLLGYPSTVPLLHVDRIGLDAALFDSATQQEACQLISGGVSRIDYDVAADRVDTIHLNDGRAVRPSFVFDATNHLRVIARHAGIKRTLVGGPQRVAFAHYRMTEAAGGTVAEPPPWTQATTLLRLEARLDVVDGLAWCIPLGDYVSIGINVDPTRTGASAALLLNWTERAFVRRGVDVRAIFSERGAPVEIPYQHFLHDRCAGANWLLAGPSCCQIWYPSAAGVGAGLIAARMAADIVASPLDGGAFYQDYIDALVASHSMLEWMSVGDPRALDEADLTARTNAMSEGNLRRLGRYLGLEVGSVELAFGDSLLRLFQDDRRLSTPVRIQTAEIEALGARAYSASANPDPWTDAVVSVPVARRPEGLQAPLAILQIVDDLSGKGDPAAPRALATEVQIDFDGLLLNGPDPWLAWVAFLRKSARVTELALVPTDVSGDDRRRVLSAQWQGKRGGATIVSAPFSIEFTMAGDVIATIRTAPADYAFVAGDSIVPRIAFVGLLASLGLVGAPATGGVAAA